MNVCLSMFFFTIRIEEWLLKEFRMVKLTVDLIAKQTTGHNKRRADENIEHYLARLTHLPFQNRTIDSIDTIPACRLLTVIYLYDNQLTKIENLHFAENLTHLYLQNNRLRKLENLDRCLKLEKLYVGGNHIQVVEGLDRCSRLKELYLENQRLAKGEKLLFDLRTLQCLANVLEILNVSGNNLHSLAELNCLEKLQELTANNNHLDNLVQLVQLLHFWPYLKRLDTSRNPMCYKPRYRERLIVVGDQLDMLDGKPVTENARKFLLSWKASREAQQTREKPRSEILMREIEPLPSGDTRRNVIKADLGLMKKSAYPTGFFESDSRKLPMTREKTLDFFISNTLHDIQRASWNVQHPVTPRTRSIQPFFK